jgi:hypothetical protein
MSAGTAGAASKAEEAEALPSPGTPSGVLRQFLIASVGGLATSIGLVAAVLTPSAGSLSAPATLETVAPTILSDASQSLDPVAGRLALDEARQCKAPLAYLTVAATPGNPPSRIRIRSGAYLSPNIVITEAPRRIAVPFPAPYISGRGVLSVEGTAQGLNVWLAPGRNFSALDGSAEIKVIWTPKSPC